VPAYAQVHCLELPVNDMKGTWKNPIKGMGWYKNTKRAFAALPED
jgi:hypothetical protein